MAPGSGALRLGGWGIIVAISAVSVGVTVVLATADQPPPTAVAKTLPRHYRLLLTDQGDNGRFRVANYGERTLPLRDGPLTIYSIRGTGKPPYPFAPELHPGDKTTTVRGHTAFVRTRSDLHGPWGRAFVWRERPRLVVAVEADFSAPKGSLRRVSEGVRIIGRRGWAHLYRQTSYAARIGHVTRYMRHVPVRRGTVAGHRWTLYALIPPHFPLSRDDLRASCVELRYRGRRGHGDNCGLLPSWQRVGGQIFAFGEVRPGIRRLRIRPYNSHRFKLTARAVRTRRGPRVRYFAAALPAGACAVRLSPESEPHDPGEVIGPIRGPDQRRCARASGG
jgi:hypothetical protein